MGRTHGEPEPPTEGNGHEGVHLQLDEELGKDGNQEVEDESTSFFIPQYYSCLLYTS